MKESEDDMRNKKQNLIKPKTSTGELNMSAIKLNHDVRQLLKKIRFPQIGRPYALFDLETTDRDVDLAKIASIAAVKVNAYGSLEVFYEYICPDHPMTTGATDVNRLTDSFLQQHGRPSKEVLNEFKAFIEDLPLIAHNGQSFDGPILATHLRDYCGFKGISLTNPLIDTMQLAMAHAGKKAPKGFKLQKLMQEIDPTYVQTHDALDDVIAMAAVYERLARKTPSFEEQFEQTGSYTLASNFVLPADVERQWPQLAEALNRGMTLDLDYKGKEKPESRRDISPFRVVSPRTMRAYCHQRNEIVNFNFDGIKKIHKVK